MQPNGSESEDQVQQLDPELRARLGMVMEEGREWWGDFDRQVRQREFHPFVPANYDRVLLTLLRLRQPGLRFLEWGSATGVITIMADMLGFEAYGIEIDAHLVAFARELATRHGSKALFALGSFLPTGYRYRGPDKDQDGRLGTLGTGESGYLQLGHPLEDFDIVFGYPWSGEEPIMRDLMTRYGRRDARLVIHGAEKDEVGHP